MLGLDHCQMGKFHCASETTYKNMNTNISRHTSHIIVTLTEIIASDSYFLFDYDKDNDVHIFYTIKGE